MNIKGSQRKPKEIQRASRKSTENQRQIKGESTETKESQEHLKEHQRKPMKTTGILKEASLRILQEASFRKLP